MHLSTSWKYALIGLVLVIAFAGIWALTRPRTTETVTETATEETDNVSTGSTEQLKLFLPADALTILGQAPLAGLEDLSTTLVSTSIELDLD